MDDRAVEGALLLMARELNEAPLRAALAAGIPVPQPAERERAARLRRRLEEVGGRVVGFASEPLPWRLAEMGDLNPAPLITTNVPPVAFEAPAVAIVGTRRATGAGMEIAHHLGAALAQMGITVVSGLARGIDGAAHRGVVQAGGIGIAVLGSGLDVVYPRRHTDLVAGLQSLGGGLVSQYAPGAEPLPFHFPRRNRLLAALADAVLVVEAHEVGGALITADAAGDLGRDVLAVPGSPLSPASAGCLQLIKDGALLVRTVDDVLEALDGETRTASSHPGPPLWYDAAPDPVAGQVLDVLGSEPVSIDSICRIVRRDVPDVARAVSRLELGGLAVRERGGVRRRLVPPRARS